MDNVVSWNETLNPLSKQRTAAKETRRLGLGVMGIADMLNQLGLGYDSEQGIQLMEKVMQFIANSAYKASAFLAEEKGSSPLYSWEKYSPCAFFQENLTSETQALVKEKGIRNIGILSIAPTGTISNAVLRSLGVQGTNIIVQNGIAAGQKAQHFMVHVIPRKERDGIKFDLQATDLLKVSQKDYSEHPAGSAAMNFIDEAKKTLEKVFKEIAFVGTGIGVEAGNFVNEIIKNIIEQNKKEVKEARERIYKELEKAEWRAW